MPSPYGELFIYQLEGRMDSRTATEAGSFLGHWQEEDSAFLFFSAPGAVVVEDILSHERDAVSRARKLIEQLRARASRKSK